MENIGLRKFCRVARFATILPSLGYHILGVVVGRSQKQVIRPNAERVVAFV